MATVLEAAQAYRADLLAGEQRARADLALAYQHALEQAQADLAALQTKIAAAQANGQTVSAAWLYREQRLSGLTGQLSDALSPYLASARLTAEQARALGLSKATDDAVRLLQSALSDSPGVLADVVHLSPQAVEQLAGQLSDASPLTELLEAIKADALAEAKQALLVGVATGQSPLQMAKALAKALDLAQWRAETITRTEALRAYREASRQTWLQNADVVSDWIWFSALDRRTCAFCWSMHGTRHPLDEAMATHPNCRCAMVPETDHRLAIKSGVERFASLSEASQLAVLGKAKLAAYQAGDLSLEDLRGFGTSPQWGRVGYERSLQSVLATKARAA